MYEDSKNNRILLRNGISIVASEDYADMILNGEEVNPNIRVVDSREAEAINTFFGIDIGWDGNETTKRDPLRSVTDSNATLGRLYYGDLTEKENVEVFLKEYAQPYRSFPITDITEEKFQRIIKELNYFQDNNHAITLDCLRNLTTELEINEVVWGVGRGSACSSYVLYLMGVHDVDPIKYNIPFSELTKEQESEYD